MLWAAGRGATVRTNCLGLQTSQCQDDHRLCSPCVGLQVRRLRCCRRKGRRAAPARPAHSRHSAHLCRPRLCLALVGQPRALRLCLRARRLGVRQPPAQVEQRVVRLAPFRGGGLALAAQLLVQPGGALLQDALLLLQPGGPGAGGEGRGCGQGPGSQWSGAARHVCAPSPAQPGPQVGGALRPVS